MGFFLLLRVVVFQASLIKMHADFWAIFLKYFSVKSIVFKNFAEVVRFVFT